MDVTMIDVCVLLVIFSVSLVLGGILAGVSYLLKVVFDQICEKLKK